MLDRVALHQTRLRTPGLSLDARGVALGPKGLVLFASLDRLVAFLAVYSEQRTLDDLVPTLRIEVVRSKLGAREVALSFAAESSDRLDGIAEAARLSGGDTFTGAGRHWVQYRDAAAPFGYDVREVVQADTDHVFYHQTYTQAFRVERALDLRALILRLGPHIDAAAGREPGPRWLVAEWGLGGALVHYFRRSGVQARAGVAEWPPASELEDEPLRRFLFELPQPPPRLHALIARTPGVYAFVPVAPGAAVEVGFRHPITLRALPVFRETGLVLFRGRGETPFELAKRPLLADVEALARFDVRLDALSTAAEGQGADAPALRVPLRLVPSTEPWRNVTAAWVERAQFPLLRRLFYLLGPDTLRRATMALTPEGAFVRNPRGIDALPLGLFYRAVGPSLFVPAGFQTLPAVGPEVLTSMFEAAEGHVVWLRPDGQALALPESAFAPLERALLEGHAWAPMPAQPFARDQRAELPALSLAVESPGANPLRDLKA
jgi:hypothetical protein